MNYLGLAEQVEGKLSSAEGRALYRLAKKARVGIVELGSWKGRSTVFMALGSKAGKNVLVYAVDHFGGSAEHRLRAKGPELNTKPEFQTNITKADVSNTISVLDMNTIEAAHSPLAPEKFDLLFIDASHDYESVKADADAWLPKLVAGGTVAFHDVIGAWSGPRRVVAELIRSGEYSQPRVVGSILWLRKEAPDNKVDIITNRLALLVCEQLGPIISIPGKIMRKLRDLGVLD